MKIGDTVFVTHTGNEPESSSCSANPRQGQSGDVGTVINKGSDVYVVEFADGGRGYHVRNGLAPFNKANWTKVFEKMMNQHARMERNQSRVA